MKETQITEVEAKLKEKKITEERRDEANLVAFKLSDEIKQLSLKEDANKNLDELLFQEVALKEKQDMEIKTLNDKISNIKKEIAEGKVTSKSFKDA